LREARAEINNKALICKAARFGLLNVYQNQIRERESDKAASLMLVRSAVATQTTMTI
jgi:hypothetical protein